jgi:hypothetical protein
MANSRDIDTVIAARAARSATGSIYNATAVNQAIAASNRSGRRIRSRERSLIHQILKGRS